MNETLLERIRREMSELQPGERRVLEDLKIVIRENPEYITLPKGLCLDDIPDCSMPVYTVPKGMGINNFIRYLQSDAHIYDNLVRN